MFRRLALIAVMIVGPSLTGLAADPSGRWEGTIFTPDGPITVAYTLTAEGEALTGTAEGPMGSAPLENGKVNGDVLTFDITMGDGAVVSHEATQTDNQMTMTARGPWGEVSFDLERQAE